MIRRRYLFGECSLDIAARALQRAGEPVGLPPTVFDCIAYLVEHRARAVGRDELVSAVWGKTEISDTMLGKAILAARRALGDSADAPTYLRTVPRFGYHWIAETRIEETGEDLAHPRAASGQPDPVATGPAPPPRRRGHIALITGLILLPILIALAFVISRSAPKGVPARVVGAASGAMLAVLPAEILAGPGDAWMRLGLMDLIATRLRDAGVAVVASDSIVRLVPAGATGDELLSAATHALDARLLVPSVRRNGEQWIVRIELVDGGVHRALVQADAGNAIAAAGAASERVLAALGRRVDARTPSTDLSLAELLQRTDAARLGEDLELARSVIETAPAAMQALPEVRLRAIRIDLRAGAFDRARAASEALLADLPREQDPVLHARALENLCVAHLRLGQMGPALQACDASIAILETREQPLALGRAHSQRGIIHARQGEQAAALADFARARIALTLAGDPLLLAQLDGNESTVEMVNGRPAEALPTLERAGRTFERFGMVNEFVTALVNRVDANLMLLQPLAALQASDQGWALRGRISDPQVRHAFEQRRADALAANGRLGEARVVLDALIHDDAAPAEPSETALARTAQARLDLGASQPATAVLLAEQAAAALSESEFAPARARSWLLQVRALHDLDRGQDAGREVEAMNAWARASGAPLVILYATLAVAEHAAFEHRGEAARAAYARAGDMAGQRAIADTTAEVAISRASFLLVEGDLEAAAATVGTLARFAERDFDCALIETRLYHALAREPAWSDALARARRLAGERRIPDRLATLAAPKPRFAAP